MTQLLSVCRWIHSREAILTSLIFISPLVGCADDDPNTDQGESVASTNGDNTNGESSNSGATSTGGSGSTGSPSGTEETNGEVTTGDLTVTSSETNAESSSASTSGEETGSSSSGDSNTGSESSTDDESSSSESTTDGGDEFNMDDPPGTLAFVGGGDDHPCEFKSWRLTDVNYGGGDTTKMRVDAVIDLTSTECDTEDITMDVIGMDYFFVSMFSQATLVIDNATMEGVNSYKATAQLNLRGITADVPIDFEFVSLMSPTRFRGTGTVDRQVFGVGPDNGPPDQVDISFDFILKK